MIARIQKSLAEKEQGFTLIELLVVIIIIGILAAIAIPVFLNQRKKAVDSGLKSDLRTIANEMETFYVDNQTYVGASAASSVVTIGTGADAVTVTASDADTVFAVTTATQSEFLITATNSVKGTGDVWQYDSDGGGLSKQ